jgi:hypothetical protein
MGVRLANQASYFMLALRIFILVLPCRFES